MSRRFKSGNVSIYMAYMVHMAIFNEDFEMTQESVQVPQDHDARKLKGKGIHEGKNVKNHCGIFALEYYGH